MRKLILVLLLILVIPSTCFSAEKMYWKSSTTTLKQIVANTTGDTCFLVTSSNTEVYRFNSSYSGSESLPNVIKANDSPTGAWIRIPFYVLSSEVSGLGTSATQDVSYFATALQGTKADSALQVESDPLSEPLLGNPSVNGYVLSSTTSGVRSWVAQSGGNGTGDMLQSMYDVEGDGLIDDDAIVSTIARDSEIPIYTNQLQNNSGYITNDPTWNGGSSGLNAATGRTSLGLVIGSNVEMWDIDLDDLADGSLTGSKVGPGIPAGNITTGFISDQRLNPTVTLDTEVAPTITKVGFVSVTQAVNLDTIESDTNTNNAKVSYTPAVPGAIGETTPNTIKATQITVQRDASDTTTCPQWQYGEQNNSVNTDIFTIKPPCTFGAMTAVYAADNDHSTLLGVVEIWVPVPATATTPCVVGWYSWDASYDYKCTTMDAWKRSARTWATW